MSGQKDYFGPSMNSALYGTAPRYNPYYYSTPSGTQYGPYSQKYSMESYPEFWRYYSQYPSRNQYPGYSSGYSSSSYYRPYQQPYSNPSYSNPSYSNPSYSNYNPNYQNYGGSYRDIVYPRPNLYYGQGGSSPDYSSNPSYYPTYPSTYPYPSAYPQPSPFRPNDPWSDMKPYDFGRRIGWLGGMNGYNNDNYPPSPHNPYPSEYGGQPLRSIRGISEVRGPGSITGTVIFRQVGNQPVSINGKISGLTPGPHGMHILELPTMGNDCLSAGEHYNPQKTEHGGKHDWNRHVGDLGNIFADKNGVATFDLTDLLISLSGGYSIINRTLVITERADDLGRGTDLGSKRDGNSGPPVACGVIRASGV
ncbi:uncharacterized protein LOC141858134 isoform X2 [Brevipalpus obovatus]